MDIHFNDLDPYSRKYPLPIDYNFSEWCDDSMDEVLIEGMLSRVPLRAVYKALWRPMSGEVSGLSFPVDSRLAKLVIEADYPAVYHRNDLVVGLRPVNCALRGVTMLDIDDLITMDVMSDQRGTPFLRVNLREREREQQKGYASAPPLPAEIRFYS